MIGRKMPGICGHAPKGEGSDGVSPRSALKPADRTKPSLQHLINPNTVHNVRSN